MKAIREITRSSWLRLNCACYGYVQCCVSEKSCHELSFRLVNHSCCIKPQYFKTEKWVWERVKALVFRFKLAHIHTRPKNPKSIIAHKSDIKRFNRSSFFSVPSFTINMVCGYKFNPFSGYFTFGCSIFCDSFFFYFFYLLGWRTHRNKLFLWSWFLCARSFCIQFYQFEIVTLPWTNLES